MSKINGSGKDLSKERMKELVPVAEAMLKIILEGDLPVGDSNAHDNAKYNAVAKEVLKLLLNENIKYVDKDFLFQLALQPIDQIREIVSMSLRDTFDRVIDKALNKEFREVRLVDLDRIILGS